MRLQNSSLLILLQQDLGLGRREVVSTQDFGRQSRAVTSREMRIIENSRLANQYGTPEYMEANDPVKRAKRAGWNGKLSIRSLAPCHRTNESQLLLLTQTMMGLVTSIWAKRIGRLN